MSKNVIAYNCDFLEIKNGVPFCTHLDKPRFLCEPFELACDLSTFEKIYKEYPLGERVGSDRCIVCRHNCQARVHCRNTQGMRCGDHPLSDGCIHKDRCKARVSSPGLVDHFCLVKNKETDWFGSCPNFEKRGEQG